MTCTEFLAILDDVLDESIAVGEATHRESKRALPNEEESAAGCPLREQRLALLQMDRPPCPPAAGGAG